ncbi:MAG: heme transporter [Sandaracinus sp.]|nr:heme transporter [Sandaracinus sp.]|tara:strand:- start:4213 stop:4962 length:750 start_codon:yes stop_codon:yes gene_type:complete
MAADATESGASTAPKSAGAPIWLMGLVAATIVAFLAFIYLVVFTAPTEVQMGVSQKIFYLHVPSAYGMYVGYTIAAVSGLIYLWKRSDRADAWSIAGAEIGTLFVVIVLITGPLWGRKAWGTFWVWDPRLTSTLLTGLIYVSFLALRSFGQVGETEKRFAAALAVVGFPLLFVIKYSVQRWSGQHPVVVSRGGGGIHPDMVPAFVMGFVVITLLAILLITVRVGLERARQELERVHIDAATSGLLGDDR